MRASVKLLRIARVLLAGKGRQCALDEQKQQGKQLLISVTPEEHINDNLKNVVNFF